MGVTRLMGLKMRDKITKDFGNSKWEKFSGTPEPCTLLLFGSGLVGLVGFGRKRLFKKA